MYFVVTFHILGHSVSIRIQKLKSRNRHSAKWRFLWVAETHLNFSRNGVNRLSRRPLFISYYNPSPRFVKRRKTTPTPLHSAKPCTRPQNAHKLWTNVRLVRFRVSKFSHFFPAYFRCNVHTRQRNTEYRIQSAFFRVLHTPGRRTRTVIKVPKMCCF